MLAGYDPYISELALHIVTLADFWRRNTTTMKPGTEVRIIRTLVETALDLDTGYAEPIARLVVKELDALEAAGGVNDANTTTWKVEVVSVLLNGYAGNAAKQPTLFEVSVNRDQLLPS